MLTHSAARARRFRRVRRAGAVTAEFAIIAPIFVIVVFGILEYGRMVMVQQIITNASREGARTAALDGATTAEVTDTVGTFLQDGSISGANVTVSPDPPSSAVFGDPVTVTITIPFADVSWLPLPAYLNNTLSATTTMRRETVQ